MQRRSRSGFRHPTEASANGNTAGAPLVRNSIAATVIVQRESTRLEDGRLYDIKEYEILKRDYERRKKYE